MAFEGGIPSLGVWRKLWLLLCASFLLIPGRPSLLLVAASVANPTTAANAAAAANSPPTTIPAAAAAAGDADAAAPVSVPPTAPGGNKFQSALKGLQQRHQDAMKDLNRQRLEMVDNVKGKIGRAKELCEERLMRGAGQGHEHVEALNEDMLGRVMSVIDETEHHGWEHVTSRRGITVHRKFMPSVNGIMSKFCCVRASGVLKASCNDVAELFEGNTRVAEYNKYFAEGRDLEYINNATKVVWASSPSIFCFKPRDYCTYVHYRKEADGTIIVLNRAAQHPEAPPNEKYVRAEVLMGASIIQPVRDDPNKCVFTTIAHINPGGLVPPFLVNKLCARGPVEFHSLVEKAAQRTRDMPKSASGDVSKYASADGGPAAIA